MTRLTTLNGADASPLCFGCMQFGGTADAAASRAMFDACRSAGVNFFDTAHGYNDGETDRFLGQFIKPDRDDLIVATKVGYSGGSGRANLRKQFDETRSRLGVEHVDVLYLHRWDADTALEETFGFLADLQQSKVIRYIGVSNFAAWQVMKAQAVAAALGTQIDLLQPMYSLVKRQAEVEIFPMARSEGFAVAAYSPLGGGLLSGKYEGGGEGRLTSDARYGARYGQDWMHKTARNFASLAGDLAIDPVTLAVAWAAQHPAMTAPIISARNVRQLAPALAASGMTLSQDVYEQISARSPRPAPATDRLEEADA